MNKILVVMCIVIGFISCKNDKQGLDKLQIAKQYYKILSNSDDSKIASLINDSLLTRETEYNYEQTFSLEQYKEWLKWDAKFGPKYEIIDIVVEGDVVKAQISKIDKRILFLHEEPIVSNQIIRFDKDKITSIETTQYVVFNDSLFVKNRSDLLNWMDENQPNLKGFIYDQTEEGAINYLKALELYANRK